MLRTRLCDLLGIDVPILAAPMGPDLSSPELAAAVSNAGGLGLVSFGLYPPPLLRDLIRRIRELTEQPFGVNFLLAWPSPEQVETCIEERVPVLSFAWGDPTPYVERAHAAGIKVVNQVGSVDDARRSADARGDVIIAQGFEAGGHVAGTVTTMALVPRVSMVGPRAGRGGRRHRRRPWAGRRPGPGSRGRLARHPLPGHARGQRPPGLQAEVLEATEEQTVHTLLFGGGWPGAPVQGTADGLRRAVAPAGRTGAGAAARRSRSSGRPGWGAR